MQLHVQNKGTLKFQSLIEIIQEQLPDPRRTSHGNIRHKLEDILIIGLCTVLCGGDSYEAMALTGRVREEYFREFLELPTGIPSADTFERVFRMLDPKRSRNAWSTGLNRNVHRAMSLPLTERRSAEVPMNAARHCMW